LTLRPVSLSLSSMTANPSMSASFSPVAMTAI
jgi:hypothetical protein